MMTDNWKTSAVASALLAVNMLQAVVPVMPPQYAAVANGVIAAAGLFLAKDYNVRK
jgi:hypothetical protein